MTRRRGPRANPGSGGEQTGAAAWTGEAAWTAGGVPGGEEATIAAPQKKAR